MHHPELLTAVFEHASDGILVIDRLGAVWRANPAACRLFGYSAKEITHRHLNELFGPAGHTECTPPEIMVLTAGKSREITGRKKSGGDLPLRLQFSEFIEHDEIRYVVTLHDLTREKQMEILLAKEQALNQIKSRLVSMASHEFRSPLSRIQLSASLIERYFQQLDKARIMDHLQKIKLAVGDMTDTLNDFLSIERIEAGNIRAECRPFDLVILAEELTEQIKGQAKAGQRVLYQHCGADQVVLLDRTLLRHCLVNLLANAVKYSEEGATVRFDTETGPQGCTIRISDEGIGIPEKDRERLFEAFFRASNALTIPGTGLGLNIVKSYTDLMGGLVSLESRENTGTTFTLAFPAAK